MVYNIWQTAKQGSYIGDELDEAPARQRYHSGVKEYWHKWIERRLTQMLLASLVLILIGGMVEIIPMFLISDNVPAIATVKPYTPLELEGRDIYIREGL